jgi:hypothetical protein
MILNNMITLVGYGLSNIDYREDDHDVNVRDLPQALWSSNGRLDSDISVAESALLFLPWEDATSSRIPQNLGHDPDQSPVEFGGLCLLRAMIWGTANRMLSDVAEYYNTTMDRHERFPRLKGRLDEVRTSYLYLHSLP